MKLGPIVLILRASDTRFGNFIGGAAELNLALTNTLRKESAFVIPLAEDAAPNELQPRAVKQNITERFGVIVALSNDTSNAEKLGILAYDQLDDVRDELFASIVGLDLGREDVITFRGGRLIDIRRDYLWYQYEFEYGSLLTSFACNTEGQDPGDGIARIQTTEVMDRQQVSQLPGLEKIFINYVLAPSAELPIDGLVEEYSSPDMSQWIDLTDDPNLGAFSTAFGTGFDWYNN